MPRYFTTRASSRRLWVEDETFANEGPLMPSLSVSDHEATDTGLLDHRGDCIMRAPNPVGFIWEE